jgi:phage gpG-like protein
MLTVQVDDSRVRVRLEQMPEKIHQKLRNAVDKLTILLQNYVRNQKLAGQVLKFHTHHLQQSIQREVTDTPTAVTGTVFQNSSLAPYGAIHEFGGVVPAHEIIAQKAQALAFIWQGKQVFFKKVFIPDVTMPERSFMRSSLTDNKDRIVQELTAAVKEGAK